MPQPCDGCVRGVHYANLMHADRNGFAGRAALLLPSGLTEMCEQSFATLSRGGVRFDAANANAQMELLELWEVSLGSHCRSSFSFQPHLIHTRNRIDDWQPATFGIIWRHVAAPHPCPVRRMQLVAIYVSSHALRVRVLKHAKNKLILLRRGHQHAPFRGGRFHTILSDSFPLFRTSAYILILCMDNTLVPAGTSLHGSISFAFLLHFSSQNEFGTCFRGLRYIPEKIQKSE